MSSRSNIDRHLGRSTAASLCRAYTQFLQRGVLKLRGDLFRVCLTCGAVLSRDSLGCTAAAELGRGTFLETDPV